MLVETNVLDPLRRPVLPYSFYNKGSNAFIVMETGNSGFTSLSEQATRTPIGW